jgi:hypothetical protein
MPRVGFDPTTPVFERAKTVHALDLVATVFGSVLSYICLSNDGLTLQFICLLILMREEN